MNEEEIQQKAQEEINNKNAVEERMKNLSKAKLEAEAKAAEESASRAVVEKERDFYQSFSDSITKYPNANEFKDSIKEKVLSGYTVEDATVAVLAREGKLSMGATPAVERQMPAGGSASNQIQTGGAKSIHEMSREERKAAVLELEARGDISNQ